MPNTMHTFETNSSNVPAFLVKLWNIVEDPTCDDIIAWSDSGTSFIIKDPTRISKEILQHYFKHSNMASFIRQLNMYGFRKVMNYEKSGLANENNEMEFHHSFFSKGHVELLEHIKRKIPNTRVSEPVKSNARDILTDLSSIREKQENMDNMLIKMKQENELLWRELTNMRKKHKAQEHVIQKVIQFLVSIVQRSNQNIGVQRKIPRMLHDSSSNQGKSQVTCTIDVLNKNPNFITVPQDKLVSPLGPVIHEVTDCEHEIEETSVSPCIKSPEDGAEKSINPAESENDESDCPLNTCLSSPLNTSVSMEPLSVLEPLQPRTPVLHTDECTVEESVLGIPLEYINAPPSNVISIPEEESCDNIISLPENSSDAYNFTPSMVVCTSAKSDYDDTLLSPESLHTPKIPTIHIEDIYPSPSAQTQKKKSGSPKKVNAKSKTDVQQNEHNYQLAVSDSSTALQSQGLTNEEKRRINFVSNSEIRLHASVPTLERRNSFSNHLINIEEELNWLQDQISTGQWNVETDKLLGLFSTDDVANNETLAGDIAAESNIATVKTEPSDIVGNELVQFTPSMLEVELDIGNNQFLQCLDQDAEVPLENISKDSEDQNITDVLNQTDHITASEAAEYLLSNGSSPRQKTFRRPKIQKLQKAKRRKIK